MGVPAGVSECAKTTTRIPERLLRSTGVTQRITNIGSQTSKEIQLLFGS